MFVQNLNERQQGVLLHYADEVMRTDRKIDAAELMAMDVLRNQSEPSCIPSFFLYMTPKIPL